VISAAGGRSAHAANRWLAFLLDDLAKSNLLNKEESNDTKTRGAGESNSKDPSRQLSHE
jgi:hypothetical protein